VPQQQHAAASTFAHGMCSVNVTVHEL
jgi:hypothetical protein